MVMVDEYMTKEEQTTITIDRLMDVRRVIKSADRDKELEDQEKVLIVKLESLGVTISELPD